MGCEACAPVAQLSLPPRPTMSTRPEPLASDAETQSATDRLKQLIAIGIALTSERELSTLLERIVAEARRFANA